LVESSNLSALTIKILQQEDFYLFESLYRG
jgi:hypothetical protein